MRDSTGNRRAARPLLRCRTTQTLHEGPPCNHRSVVVRGYNDARQRHSRRGHGITWRGTGGAWRPHQCFSFSGEALGGCQPPPHHTNATGRTPPGGRQPPAFESPVRRKSLISARRPQSGSTGAREAVVGKPGCSRIRPNHYFYPIRNWCWATRARITR